MGALMSQARTSTITSPHLRTLVGFGLWLLVLLALWRPVGAWAADDMIDSWTATYTVQASGAVHVEETLVYRFGDDSGRHGIDRTLVTRQPWGSTGKDAVYYISNIKVTSTGASSQFTTSTLGSGRDQQIRIRIGSPNQTVETPTETYTLSYDIAGALRHTDTGGELYDELYWNAIGDATPIVSSASVTVIVPGGVQDVRCYTGPAHSQTRCSSAVVGPDGVATFTQTEKGPGSFLTIAAQITPGLVADNQPHLVARSWGMLGVLAPGLCITGAGALATALAVVVFARRQPRDDRFLRVAPGTIGGANVGPDDHPILPVQFAPPDVAVADAGVLDDGRIEVRDMTATLLSLAVRGVVKLREQPVPGRRKLQRVVVVTLLTRDKPKTVAEQGLVRQLFLDSKPGAERWLTGKDYLDAVYRKFVKDIRHQVRGEKWFKRPPSVSKAAPGFKRPIPADTIFGIVVGSVVGFSLVLSIIGEHVSKAVFLALVTKWWPAVACLVIMLIGYAVYRWLPQRPPRTALGRAYADQLTGFRKYLATAEADQLRFEEGQDIFAEYLPWAVIFGLTKRWTKICQQLVRQGRLASLSIDWYDGDLASFKSSAINQSLSGISQTSQSFEPAIANSGSLGSGGGSAFGSSGGGDGGGSSGDGGGGGGASSW